MYAAGQGYGEIGSKLTIKLYRTQTGRPFAKNSLHDILRNEKYRGIYTFNRSERKTDGKRNHHKSKNPDEIIKIEGGMPRIISDEIWEKVRARMEKNKRGPAANKAKEIFLLSVLIFCCKCGGAMVGNRRYSGRNKSLYITMNVQPVKGKRHVTGKTSERTL